VAAATSSQALLPSTQPPKRYRAHADEADPRLQKAWVPGLGSEPWEVCVARADPGILGDGAIPVLASCCSPAAGRTAC